MKDPPLRIVLDTNVVVSSLWGGKPKRVLDLWQEGRFKVLVSLEILQEYQNVLERFSLAEDEVETFLALFTAPRLAVLVRPRLRHTVISEDPSDDMFLDCAVAGKSDCVVSGDFHLLKLKAFAGIPILKPAAFLNAFALNDAI